MEYKKVNGKIEDDPVYGKVFKASLHEFKLAGYKNIDSFYNRLQLVADDEAIAFDIERNKNLTKRDFSEFENRISPNAMEVYRLSY